MKDSVEPALLLLEAGANPRQSRYGEPGSGLVLKRWHGFIRTCRMCFGTR